MKIRISNDNGVIRGYNNEIPCVFIKPKAKIVKIIENGVVEEFVFKFSRLEEILDEELDVSEVHYTILVGDKLG